MSAVPVTIGVGCRGAAPRLDARRRARSTSADDAGVAARRHVRARAPRPAHLAHRPLLAALHVLHARAGQRVARQDQHPDARRDRARSRASPRPPASRRSASPAASRCCAPTSSRSSAASPRSTGPTGDPVELAMTTNGIRLPELLPGLIDAGLGPPQHLARHAAARPLPRPHPPRSARRRARGDRGGRGIRASSAQAQRRRDARRQRRRARRPRRSSRSTTTRELRFIEQMPLDAGHTWDRSRMVTRDEILDALVDALDAHPGARARGSARPSGGRSTAVRARWASSRRSPRRSAATAIACGSPPTASCATACSRRPSTTCCRSSATAARTERSTRDRPDAALLRARQASRSRDQRPVVPAAGARHERDRRLSMGRLTDAHSRSSGLATVGDVGETAAAPTRSPSRSRSRSASAARRSRSRCAPRARRRARRGIPGVGGRDLARREFRSAIHCGGPGTGGRGDPAATSPRRRHADVDGTPTTCSTSPLAPGVAPPVTDIARNFYTTSSCGLCGKASIEAVETRVALRRGDGCRDRGCRDCSSTLPDALRAGQAVFDKTGGLHAAALFDAASGELLVRPRGRRPPQRRRQGHRLGGARTTGCRCAGRCCRCRAGRASSSCRRP